MSVWKYNIPNYVWSKWRDPAEIKRLTPPLPAERLESGTSRRNVLKGLALGDAGTVPVLHRKLLMIASALATKPKLLLLDEPVGGLNHDEIDAVMRLVRSLKHERSVTVVLIEHVMRFLVALSDRVLIMHHGQKIYEGSPEGLPKDRTVVEVYLGKGTAERLQHVIEEERAHGAA